MVAPSSHSQDDVVYWDGNGATDRDYMLLRFELAALPPITAVAAATLRWHADDAGNAGELHEPRPFPVTTLPVRCPLTTPPLTIP
jgi:hypothetical protein